MIMWIYSIEQVFDLRIRWRIKFYETFTYFYVSILSRSHIVIREYDFCIQISKFKNGEKFIFKMYLWISLNLM